MITDREMTLLEEFSQFSFFSFPESSCFENVEKDSCGNCHFIKHGTGKKVQIIFRVAPIGVLVGNKKEDGYAATILGNEKKKHLADEVLYAQGNAVGILRSDKENQWHIENFDDISDVLNEILIRMSCFICKGEKLYSGCLDELLSLLFAHYVVSDSDISDKSVDFTVWNSSLADESGLVSAIRYANADKIIYLSLVDAKECPTDIEPSLVLKDGNYVFPVEQREKVMEWAKDNGLSLESFVGKTDKAMEQMDIHSFGKDFWGIYLPTHHFQSDMEEILWSNVEKTRNILLKFITVL